MNTFLCAVLCLAAVCGLGGCKPDGPASYQGYVEGEFVYVAGKIGGRLDELAVSRGQRVTPGQPLYVLEHAFEAAALAQAQADLRQAEATLDDRKKGLRPEEIAQIEADLGRAQAARELSRLEYDRRIKLYGSAVIAQEELDTSRTTHTRDKQQVRELEAKLATGKLPSRIDQIRAAADAVDAARAMVAQAQWNLDQMRQPALVGGLVYDLLHYRGEWTAAGSPVVVLLPDANVKARFFVPEAVAGGLKPGQPVRVAWDGGGEAVAATISYIAPKVEYTPPVIYSQGFREKLVVMVEASFDPAVAPRLHPGLPIDVYLEPAGAGAKP